MLRAYRDYRSLFEEWSYRAAGKGSSLDVDFLLRRGDSRVALEVKASRRVDPAELRGLHAVAELAGVRRRLVVYRGERPFRTADGIEILPVAAFLAEVEGDTLFG